jgi:predicted acylesterase/phospholipase RssA
MNGAYSAGFLAGWSKTGTRPEFDVVTGVSTGALVAAAAFLGPEYDDLARQCYTRVRASDVYNYRAWVLIPWSGSVASSDPLKRLIDRVVQPEFVQKVAREHARGRRLYVGTTNLSTERLTVWDMGAVASRGGSVAVERFRRILLASCSVPGMFPPVPFEPADGSGPQELHADGGVSSNVFVPIGVIAPEPNGRPSGTDVYIVLAHKLFADPRPVRARVPSVLAATTSTIIHANARTETGRLYHLSKSAGANFHMTAVPDEHRAEAIALSFDPELLTELYDAGFQLGSAGPTWMRDPPFETTADKIRD